MACIFCEIVSKKASAYTIYENDLVCCFLDKYPINTGHVLVIPKKHYQELTDVDQESLSQVILVSQKVAKALEEILNTDGITIMQNNGKFKDVEHYHMHIIPRFLNDGFSWIEPDVNVIEDEFVHLSSSLERLLSKS
ncbi:HIT family protein [Virgibacillus profundi]|uniref:HIT family protein n=1 Tax=Virgibacillus profundi TaxID=2024555 RepID=A0A2A2IA07_9BACI|nr:HIT family protein [Virgibacillus profundi]PAV27965.1 HIT family protein [Virgibacillus profundi]PXY52143.1 HIT family protein [Virgibacillus profundi]